MVPHPESQRTSVLENQKRLSNTGILIQLDPTFLLPQSGTSVKPVLCARVLVDQGLSDCSRVRSKIHLPGMWGMHFQNLAIE